MRPAPPAPCAMTDEQHGPGMVRLDRFVEQRLDEDQTAGRDPAVVAAHRRIVDAYRASRDWSLHKAGVGLGLKAVASIYADHPDYDSTWHR